MPLNEEIKGLYCRTGNYMLFHFFHLRHRLPGSAALIISQNFASCRLACSFKVTLFLVFIPITSFPYQLAWVNVGCGILVEYHFSLWSTILFSMEEFMEGVNRVNPVFHEEKSSRLKQASNRSPKKLSFPGCSKRALPTPRLRQAGRCKLSSAKSRPAGPPKSLAGNAYMRSLLLYAATTKDEENAADGQFSATC
jgi:hypothetical protein